MTYTLRVPDDYDAERGAPLVVALHGSGDTHENFMKCMGSRLVEGGSLSAYRDCIWVVPDAPDRVSWTPDRDGPEILRICRAVCGEFPVTWRMVLGHSAGGWTAMHLVQQAPGDWESVLVSAAGMPDGWTAPAGERVRGVPFRFVVGADDPNRPHSEGAPAAMERMGFRHVACDVVPGKGHELCIEQIQAARAWFDEMRRREGLARPLTPQEYAALLAPFREACKSADWAAVAENGAKIVGSGLPAAATDFLSGVRPLLRTPPEDVALLAAVVELVGRSGADGSARIAAGYLSDARSDVACAAARGLGATAEKRDAIGALLRELRAAQPPLSEAIEEALRTLTGAEGVTGAEGWNRWWTRNRSTFGRE